MSIGATREPQPASTANPTVPAQSGTRFLLLNSAVAFALALMTMVTLHELAHAVTALSLGLNATLHSGSVYVPNYRSDSERITTALAGPFFSLISGLLILALPRFGRGFWRLFVMWLGLLSVQEFVGYLMTAPFVTFGDIGQALRLAGAPFWTFILSFLLGLAGMFLLGRAATRRLLEFTREGTDSISDQLSSLGLFAWLLGVLAVIVLGAGSDSLSRDGLFELAGGISSGIFLVFVRLVMKGALVRGQGLVAGWPVVGMVLVVLFSIFRHFVLGPGIPL